MRQAFLVATVILGVLVTLTFWAPIGQDPAYHIMADARTMLGIPNALNVLSNLPFAIVGALGLFVAFRFDGGLSPFHTSWERWPAAALFSGVALTAVGSSYYHLAPDNGRLVWDRLPITVGFMGLLTLVIAERASLRAARVLFAPLLIAGAVSVVYWYRTEVSGAGDLRPYALVQFGSLLAVIVLLVVGHPRYPGAKYLVAGLITYAAAKIFEMADRKIYLATLIVSGHTLKHLVAAGGVAFLVAMLRSRVRRGHLSAVVSG